MQTAYEGLSPKAKELIQRMLNSGDSQQVAVGECLNTIAENDEEQSTDEHLICCAREIAAAANAFCNVLQPLKKYTAFCQEVSGEGTIWISFVDAIDVENAKHVAKEACARDWDWLDDPTDYRTTIHVLGIAAGEVEIEYWEDICDVER